MRFEAKQGDRVDLLIWAKTGRDKGVVERVLDAIPGLSAIQFNLPIGYVFEVPDELLKPQQVKQMKRLW